MRFQAVSVYCWGANGSGQLGNGTTNNANRAVSVKKEGGDTSLTDVGIVAAGGSHTCAAVLKDDGDDEVYCWGNNAGGRLGVGAVDNDGNVITNVTKATKVIFPSTPDPKDSTQSSSDHFLSDVIKDGNDITDHGDGIKELIAGKDHMCIRVENPTKGKNKIYCWGASEYGEAGTLATTQKTLHEVPLVDKHGQSLTSDLNPVQQIVSSSSARHSCFMTGKDQGKDVYCWGAGNYYQLGNGVKTEKSAKPVRADIYCGFRSLLFSYTLEGSMRDSASVVTKTYESPLLVEVDFDDKITRCVGLVDKNVYGKTCPSHYALSGFNYRGEAECERLSVDR